MLAKKLNILIIGKGYISTSLKQDVRKKFNVFSISKNKLNIKKKIKNIDILIHPIGLNRAQSKINPKKAILVKKKYTNKIIKFAEKNRIKKIIYLSTIHVYSKNLLGSIKESTKCKNTHPYALAHVCAENILKKKSNKDLKVIILRISNLFGIRKKKNRTQFLLVVNSFMKQSVVKKKIIVNEKYLIRDFIPFNDFIKKLNQCFFFNEKFRIINIGYKSYTLFYMAKLISRRANKLFNLKTKIICEDSQVMNSRNNQLQYKSVLKKKIKTNSSLINEIDFSLKILKQKYTQ